jgi:hypothetical protein
LLVFLVFLGATAPAYGYEHCHPGTSLPYLQVYSIPWVFTGSIEPHFTGWSPWTGALARPVPDGLAGTELILLKELFITLSIFVLINPYRASSDMGFEA